MTLSPMLIIPNQQTFFNNPLEEAKPINVCTLNLTSTETAGVDILIIQINGLQKATIRLK